MSSGGQRVNFVGSANGAVQFGVGVLMCMPHVHVDGLANKNFWLIDPRDDTAETCRFDVFSVLLAGGVERGFVGLEGVPCAFVKLRNVWVGLLEGKEGPPELSVIDTGSHADALWVVVTVNGFRVEVVYHVELP